MTVGILGLGLIGGSLARAYAKAGHTVYAAENDKSILDFAMLANVVNAPLTEENIGSCDLILLAIYSDASASWLEENAKIIFKGSSWCGFYNIKVQMSRWYTKRTKIMSENCA